MVNTDTSKDNWFIKWVIIGSLCGAFANDLIDAVLSGVYLLFLYYYITRYMKESRDEH